MKFYQTTEFKHQQKYWRKKLRESGFKDIELGDDKMMSYSYQVGKTYDSFTFDYYELAKELIETYKFKNKTEEFVWKSHCEGHSSRQIKALLPLNGLKQISHDTIWRIIVRIESKMFESLR